MIDTIPSTEAHLYETEKKSESIRALPENYQYCRTTTLCSEVNQITEQRGLQRPS
jgi:hypothetical protein